MTAPAERCDLSDLLVEHCGCRKHKPGVAIPDLDPDGARRGEAYDLEFVVKAQYDGRCPECKDRISFGELIVPRRSTIPGGQQVTGWAHLECAREAED